MKDSFVLYKSHFDSICLLPDPESQIKVLKRICDFMFNDVEPVTEDLSTTEKIIVTMAMPTLNNAKINYENGCKGGAPIGNQNARKKTTENNPPCFDKTTPKTSNVNVNVNLNDNDKDNVVCKCNDNNNNNSLTPTLQEVIAYCNEQDLKISPEYFFNYYEQRSWKDVKDWKLCCLGWNKNQKVPAENKNKHSYLKKDKCPGCGAKTLWWNDKMQKYNCDSCSGIYEYEVIHGN